MLFLSGLATSCASGAPQARPAGEAGTRCQLRVILGVLPGGEPGAVELPAAAQAAGERLTYLRTITPQHALYELSGPGGPEACRAALARLARDPHLRSAEPDGQRRAQE